MDTQFKAYQCKTEDANDSKRTIVSRISTITVDRAQEVLLPSGIELEGYNGIVLWAHDYGGDTLPIGRNMWVKTNDTEVIAKTEFNDLPFSQDIYKLYRDGFLNSWSVGFIPKASREPEQADLKAHPEWKDVTRIITAWPLLEYSAVKVPANPDALTLAMGKGLTLQPETVKALAIEPTPAPEPTKKEEPKPPRIILAAPHILEGKPGKPVKGRTGPGPLTSPDGAMYDEMSRKIQEEIRRQLYLKRGGV